VHDIYVRKPLDEIYQNDEDYEEDNIGDHGFEGEAWAGDAVDNDLADFEAPGENKYARMQKQREKERKIRENKKWEFPNKIGSYNEFHVPALEFLKQLCNNVFGLDDAFSL
jgi:hypothetical protein